MRIRFTLDIERRRKDTEPEPWNDAASSSERAEYTNGPQIGFTRELYYDDESGSRGVRPRR